MYGSSVTAQLAASPEGLISIKLVSSSDCLAANFRIDLDNVLKIMCKEVAVDNIKTLSEYFCEVTEETTQNLSQD
jgi:hypothetical protein